MGSGRRATEHKKDSNLEGESESEEVAEEAESGLKREEESESDYACRLQRESPRELTATALLAAAGMVAAYFIREAFVHLIWWVKQRRGLAKGASLTPFPSWELQVLLAQLQGLAESSGDAIGSRCVAYEVAGGFVLLFLLLAVAGSCAIVVWGLWFNEAQWRHVSIKECFQNMKEVMGKDAEDKSVFGRIKGIYDAIGILHVRGEWDEHDVFLAKRIHRHMRHGHLAHHASKTLETRFVERWGPLFDSWHRKAWWYGVWGMSKAVMLGVILANVLDPIRNASAVLTLASADSLIIVIFNPDGDWHEVFKNAFRSITNVAVIASVLAFVQGHVDTEWFSQAFQTLSIISILPMILSAYFSPAINAINHLWVFAKHVRHFCGSAGMPGGAAGVLAVGVAAGAMAGVDKDQLMDTVDDVRGANEEEEGGAGAVEAGPPASRGAELQPLSEQSEPRPGPTNAAASQHAASAGAQFSDTGAVARYVPARPGPAETLRAYMQSGQMGRGFPPQVDPSQGFQVGNGTMPAAPFPATAQLVFAAHSHPTGFFQDYRPY